MESDLKVKISTTYFITKKQILMCHVYQELNVITLEDISHQDTS